MRVWIFICILLSLAACEKSNRVFVSKEQIAAVSYRDEGPSKLTLITMVNNETGAGAHTSLLINGPKRILFDPAGSFRTFDVPEKGDVIYGVTPELFRTYKSAHARLTHHVVIQEITVSDTQAQVAYQLAIQNGPVVGAFCTNATSKLLSRVPGFEEIKVTFYPVKLQNQIDRIPGVKTEKYYEDDSGNVLDAIRAN